MGDVALALDTRSAAFAPKVAPASSAMVAVRVRVRWIDMGDFLLGTR
jgi:hypothetical protein